ncbi:MAG: NADPH-dependent F420 reductase [Gammaproteobacteria bacterium]|nr:MAG: NADPH-dependent F420 reductase [Gammaproteobacteria bacterium]
MSGRKRIAVLGGTGNLGYGLALRWARAGHEIAIGSRSADRAQEAAGRIGEASGSSDVTGMDNATAAQWGEIVTLTVPWAAHDATLETILPSLHGQVLIDTTVPLKPPRVAVVQLPEGGPVAVRTQALVGDRARVAGAFHNIAAGLLTSGAVIDCDVLVTADDPETRRLVIELAGEAGCRGLDAGPLANSVVPEALTSILIHINRTYRAGHAGIRITGIETCPDEPPSD